MVKKFEKKIAVFFWLVILAFVSLAARLAYLQIYASEQFVQKAESNRIRMIPMTAPRGFFYDRYGKILVKNRSAFTVSIVPMDLRQTASVVRKLSEILNMSEAEIYAKLKDRSKESFEPVRLKIDVSPETVVMIEERKTELPGVMIETDAIRDYPRGDWASLLFGYVGEINAEELKALKGKDYRIGDIVGKLGLEKSFDSYLKGEDGGRQVEVNAIGHPVRVLGIKPPKRGSDLVLTIDPKLQSAAENAIYTNFGTSKGAAVIVMDPNTGEILAFVSKPGFDPNKFAGGISQADYLSLVKNPLNPFRDRVIQNAYPPGSIYKIITGIAALELGKTNEKELFYDPGYYPPLPRFHCWFHPGHGSINIVDGYAKSCNIVFYTLGERVGIDNLARYQNMFGLGQKTGIELANEEKGLAPSREWRRKAFAGRPEMQVWYRGETLNTAIGQGDHLYTPIQIVRMLSAVVNGGKLLKPFVVKKILNDGKVVKIFEPKAVGKINVSPTTIEIVKKGLRAVVARGTARVVDLPNVEVGGKTGSAEAPGGDSHAWFACFAPLDKPKIAIVVFVEHGGGGGANAAPIARKILEAAFPVVKAKKGK